MAQSRRGSKRPGGRADGRRQGQGGSAPRGQGRKGHKGGRFFAETKVWRDPTMTSRTTEAAASAIAAAASVPVAEPPAPEATPRRIVVGPKPVTVDAKELERQRLLARVLTSEGRPSITRAVDDYLAASHELPREQAVWLQVLEHRDEAKVARAIEVLGAILAEAAVERRAVLESRLRRIEELAEERATRSAAGDLRRLLQGGAPAARASEADGVSEA